MPYISIHFLEWEQEIYGNSGELYTVKWGANKFSKGHRAQDKYQWSCTCPDFMYHGVPQSKYCRHIENVIENDERCLWTDVDGELPLFHGLTVGIRRAFNHQSASGNIPILSKTVRDALSAMTAYCPFEWHGEYVQAKYVTVEEWTTQIKPVAYTFSRNILTEGDLTQKQFAVLLRFLTSGQKEDWKKCVIAGFDVNGRFTLSSQKVSKDNPCPVCNSSQVSLKDYAPDIYACVNRECEKSVNHESMIDARQARAKSYGLQVYRPTQAELAYSSKKPNQPKQVMPDLPQKGGNNFQNDIE